MEVITEKSFVKDFLLWVKEICRKNIMLLIPFHNFRNYTVVFYTRLTYGDNYLQKDKENLKSG